MPTYAVRLTQAQQRVLHAHLFPGDGLEAVALLICGRRTGEHTHVFTVQDVVPIPYSECPLRLADCVTWNTDTLDAVLAQVFATGRAVVKVHSHPNGYARFSDRDEQSDSAVSQFVASYLDDGLPHASLIMLPDGSMFGRALQDGRVLDDLASVAVVGDDIHMYVAHAQRTQRFALRHQQAFGSGTIQVLSQCAVAVVGASGTGSIVVEQLARLGVGRLVLVDPEVIEDKNRNRVLNASKEDAFLARSKVHVLASAVARMGLGTDVEALQCDLMSKAAVEAVAQCDIVFGCMDGAEGRHLLNRLASFYTMPYFDVGVRLDADGRGGIDTISGAVHYIRPGGSSLLSRGVYTMARVTAEGLRRTNPSEYARQVKEGYLRGVEEDRPAVISVNMFFAALAINEMLGRLHRHRNRPNSAYAYVGASLSEVQIYTEDDGQPCPVFSRHIGRGDTAPLLGLPTLS